LLHGLRDARVGRYRIEVDVTIVLMFANRLEKYKATVDVDPE
jgi:hypothetical protein